MGLMNDAERDLAQAYSNLSFCNPFLEERVAFEKAILGDAYKGSRSFWSMQTDREAQAPNLMGLAAAAKGLADTLRKRLCKSPKCTATEWALYQDIVVYVLYDLNREGLRDVAVEFARDGKAPSTKLAYRTLREQYRHYLALPGIKHESIYEAEHVFAMCFQLSRAFYHIFESIVGGSLPAAQLRAEVWQSLFTYDMRRYIRSLYGRMSDMTTLITGPTGTGKELVARAIGLSRYIPYDAVQGGFADDFSASFQPLNLSALSRTLIESELFGHRRGAYTGALDDHVGYLEKCSEYGTVFLDEIGELDLEIQVKMLRVLQTRIFHRLGDTSAQEFKGKIIAATNRDLATEIAEGGFRSDFYYRLCADHISTPSLAEQLGESPEELETMVRFIAKRSSNEDEADRLTEEVLAWIKNGLPEYYMWPGNFRELEQCVRNVLIRGEYHPAVLATERDPYAQLLAAARTGTLTANEVLSRYCTLVYSRTQNYQEAARQLNLDRRTVQRYVNADMLAKLDENGE
jgi:DNA-binding NtrC family response regulator